MRSGVTAPRLFGGMDVPLILNCNRALRAWDRTSAPAQSREDFVIEAGYLLWVEAPRGQTVGDSIRVSLPRRGGGRFPRGPAAMIRCKAVIVLLAALLAVAASTATLAANDGAPSLADADCLTWRVSYANAIDGRSAAVDFTVHETARRFRDGLCGRTPFPIFVDVEGPACLRV